MNKNQTKLAEIELIVIMALMILLGFIIGQSFAATKGTQVLTPTSSTETMRLGDEDKF